MSSPDILTIQALRSDVARQIARIVKRGGESQVAAARRLGIPQPTLSKIMRGKVTVLSLELILRIAVRAGCPLVLQTGKDPAEAGAYLARAKIAGVERTASKVSTAASDALASDVRHLTPSQRLETQLRHSELVSALSRAGRM